MFDRYAAATAPSWGRRALVVASVGLHVSAAVALMIYSIFHVEEIAPPALSLTFFSAPPPPPPPPPPARKKSSSTEKKITPTQIVTPTTQVKIVQPKQEEKKDDGKDDGEEGGVEGGVAGGTKGGTVGGTVGGTGTDVNAKPGPSQAVPFFTLQCTKPDPHLPDEFKSSHPKQTIKANYAIEFDASGAVIDVRAVVAVPGADASIRDQIKHTWRCKPPKPIPFHTTFPFSFQIN